MTTFNTHGWTREEAIALIVKLRVNGVLHPSRENELIVSLLTHFAAELAYYEEQEQLKKELGEE